MLYSGTTYDPHMLRAQLGLRTHKGDAPPALDSSCHCLTL
jgi:hypothetical protein